LNLTIITLTPLTTSTIPRRLTQALGLAAYCNKNQIFRCDEPIAIVNAKPRQVPTDEFHTDATDRSYRPL